MHGFDGVPAPIQDALTILAARGDDPPSVARGHEAFRALLAEMHAGRLKRLVHAGFSAEDAETHWDAGYRSLLGESPPRTTLCRAQGATATSCQQRRPAHSEDHHRPEGLRRQHRDRWLKHESCDARAEQEREPDFARKNTYCGPNDIDDCEEAGA
jgi:hypothetical protein